MMPMMNSMILYEKKMTVSPTKTLTSTCFNSLWDSSVPEMLLNPAITRRYSPTLPAKDAETVITQRKSSAKLIFGPGRLFSSSPRRDWELVMASCCSLKALIASSSAVLSTAFFLSTTFFTGSTKAKAGRRLWKLKKPMRAMVNSIC